MKSVEAAIITDQVICMQSKNGFGSKIFSVSAKSNCFAADTENISDPNQFFSRNLFPSSTVLSINDRKKLREKKFNDMKESLSVSSRMNLDLYYNTKKDFTDFDISGLVSYISFSSLTSNAGVMFCRGNILANFLNYLSLPSSSYDNFVHDQMVKYIDETNKWFQETVEKQNKSVHKSMKIRLSVAKDFNLQLNERRCEEREKIILKIS